MKITAKYYFNIYTRFNDFLRKQSYMFNMGS